MLENEKVAQSPLGVLVCGFEQGGTTMLTELLRMSNKVESGFEGGVLLEQEPKDFVNQSVYYASMMKHWKLDSNDMEVICSSPSFKMIHKIIYTVAS